MIKSPHIFAIGMTMACVKFALCEPPIPLPIEESGQWIPNNVVRDVVEEEPITTDKKLERYIGHWEIESDPPIVPVFGGTVIDTRRGLAILGGFNQSLETTKIIQIRQQQRGWLPIGTQMIESRALHTMTQLDDDRVLIVGGVSGQLGDEIIALNTCEILNPFIAGTVQVESIEEPMLGHTAHRLSNGKVLIIGGSAARVFDSESMKWTTKIKLNKPRKNHTAVKLANGDFLVIGGDEEGSIETLILSGDNAGVILWTAGLETPLANMGAALLQDGRVFLVGGIDIKSHLSVGNTWLIDPHNGLIVAGPDLALDNGVADAAVFLESGMMVVLGGEWFKDNSRGPANSARVYNPVDNRLWSLPEIPNNTSRRMWYRDKTGQITARGGYLYVSGITAATHEMMPGINISTDNITIITGKLPFMED